MANQTTILILEDDLNLMEGIRDILQLQGYEILAASNGEEGLNVLKNRDPLPNLIVSDIMMPVMDGYQFLEAVRRDQRLMMIPFIFLTAKGEKADVRAGKLLGADDYIVKPFEAEDLIAGISAKLRRQQELNQHQASEISDIKRRILTILHHEFRTPLTYVIAYSDLLNQEVDGLSRDDLQSFLGGLASGADRLRRLVENLIFLVELETGEADSTYKWRRRRLLHGDIEAILMGALADMKGYAETRSVRLEMEPLPDALPSIVCDAEYLRGALVRLVENGIKFNDKQDGVVRVAAAADERYVWISVLDNGRGIPKSQQESIFEVFHQVDRHIHEDQGAGAGLPIVKRIVELHGGCVQVESCPGEGSQFLVGLPLDAGEEAE